MNRYGDDRLEHRDDHAGPEIDAFEERKWETAPRGRLRPVPGDDEFEIYGSAWLWRNAQARGEA